jgi:hypothetical protein
MSLSCVIDVQFSGGYMAKIVVGRSIKQDCYGNYSYSVEGMWPNPGDSFGQVQSDWLEVEITKEIVDSLLPGIMAEEGSIETTIKFLWEMEIQKRKSVAKQVFIHKLLARCRKDIC